MVLFNDRRDANGPTQVGLSCKRCHEAGRTTGPNEQVGGAHGMLGFRSPATHVAAADHPFVPNQEGIMRERWPNQRQGAPDTRSRLRRVLSAI